MAVSLVVCQSHWWSASLTGGPVSLTDGLWVSLVVCGLTGGLSVPPRMSLLWCHWWCVSPTGEICQSHWWCVSPTGD